MSSKISPSARKVQEALIEDLLQYDEIWAAAGTPKAIFKLTPQELQKITGGRVVSVK
jgi:prolyl-tRNA editing enzyme YbaK/EbsC (Cys-tRNA(Pro) deacylase)